MEWLATWKDLEAVPWFVHVGEPVSERVVLAESWPDAIRLATSIDFDNLKLAAANAFRRKLQEVAPAEMRRWNSVVREVKVVVEPVIDDRVARIGLEPSLRHELKTVVEWDIVGMLAQAEFFNTVPNGFCLGLGYWYKIGRFPCGWQGTHPEGRLIVY